jgi:cell wall-associated NlpC family hydrolase
MQTFQRCRRLMLFLNACLLCILFGLSNKVSAEATPPAKPEPNTALTRLQEFTNRASELAISAMGMLGIRYKYGGTTPESGLVRYVFKEAWGASLPRTAEEISQVGQHVETSELQPGDLVFYNTLKRGFSHVGIYLGDNKFIHSPSAGGEVRIESMDISYWKKRFNGARRILDPEQKSSN